MGVCLKPTWLCIKHHFCIIANINLHPDRTTKSENEITKNYSLFHSHTTAWHDFVTGPYSQRFHYWVLALLEPQSGQFSLVHAEICASPGRGVSFVDTSRWWVPTYCCVNLPPLQPKMQTKQILIHSPKQKGYPDKHFFYLSMKTYIVGTH